MSSRTSATLAVASATPARKRVRKPAVPRDPVIAALIAKLPGDGATFTRDQRINWLRQMAMAMDGAYGVAAAVPIDKSDQPSPAEVAEANRRKAYDQMQPPAPPQPLLAQADDDEIRYFVDANGYARKDPGGQRIDPFDMPHGAELEDERVGDDELDSIKWKSGQFPPAAYPDRSFSVTKSTA